jgi:Asp-tRNA(Asn)/Glu-tRNA(Gln) amidotransferase A subunit family amidase
MRMGATHFLMKRLPKVATEPDGPRPTPAQAEHYCQCGIVVPGGFSSQTPTAALGVPVGIEFLGRPWSEKVLIEIVYGYEQATKHRRPPPTTPPLLPAR